MSIGRIHKTFTIFACLISFIAIVTYFSNRMDYNVAIGLSVGSFSAIINYFLLLSFIKSLTEERFIFAIQLYVLRFLIYLLTAFVSVRFGTSAALAFSASIVAISVSISAAYMIDPNSRAVKGDAKK